MSNYTQISRQFAHRLDPGEHSLSNDDLRAVYGMGRVTATSRATVAVELRRVGLEVLSDPAVEPLVVRKTARRKAVAVLPRPWWQRGWVAAIGAVALLLLLGGVGGVFAGGGSNDQQAVADVATETSTTTTETQPTEPAQTYEDARNAVEDDDFPTALAIAAALGHDDRNRIRRVISRTLARQVRAALRNGNRSSAKSILAQADSYPATPEIRQARSAYKAAKARAAYRAELRREQRAAAREADRQRRAAAKARAEAERAAEEAYEPPSYAPSTSAPSTSGPSSTNWCGKRDGDGDGIYCEGE